MVLDGERGTEKMEEGLTCTTVIGPYVSGPACGQPGRRITGACRHEHVETSEAICAHHEALAGTAYLACIRCYAGKEPHVCPWTVITGASSSGDRAPAS